MNSTIKLILNYMDGEFARNYKPRTPVPDETPEQAEGADLVHEVDFFAAESFKLGILLGLEVAKK